MKNVLSSRGFSGFPWAATVRLFSIKSRFEARILLVATAGLCFGMCAGCRSIVDGLGNWRGPAADERWGSSAIPLSADLWRYNSAWSPLHELDEVPISNPDVPLCRWTHPHLRTALKQAESDGLIPADVRRNAEATVLGQAAGPADASLNVWFSNLAKKDDLAGWNAAMLWAQYDPSAAREAADILSRLVQRPPCYQPEEKATIRAQSTAKESVP